MSTTAGSMRTSEGKPSVGNMASFHAVEAELIDAISTVRLYRSNLDNEMVAELVKVVGKAKGRVNFEVSEVNKQYALFLKLQEMVVNGHGEMMEEATIKDLGTMITSMSSLISLFLKAQRDIDTLGAEADLKKAVLAAVSGLDKAAQDRFFEQLDAG